MGYYVTLIEADAYIPTEKLDEAYTLLCALNERNDLKRGGAWPREEKEGPHDGIWFSWMDWNYPETCADAKAILEQLGFEVAETEDGLHLQRYDNKTGNEDHFLNALAPVIVGYCEPAYLLWKGEDGAWWKQQFADGVMSTHDGHLVFSD